MHSVFVYVASLSQVALCIGLCSESESGLHSVLVYVVSLSQVALCIGLCSETESGFTLYWSM